MNFEIGKGNKITIPDILMREYGLREKDVFELELENDRIILIPKKNYDANYVGKLRGLVDDIIDALHEDKQTARTIVKSTTVLFSYKKLIKSIELEVRYATI